MQKKIQIKILGTIVLIISTIIVLTLFIRAVINRPLEIEKEVIETPIQKTVIIEPQPIVNVPEVKQPEPEDEMPHYNIPLSQELQRFTYELSIKNDMRYEMLLAVMKLESNFNIKAVSRNGNRSSDFGLCQLNSKHYKWYGELAGINNIDVFNPYHSIQACVAGLNYYKDYWQQQGIEDDESLWCYTLSSYNLGVYGYKRYLKNSKGINTPYTKRILNLIGQLEKNGEFNE